MGNFPGIMMLGTVRSIGSCDGTLAGRTNELSDPTSSSSGCAAGHATLRALVPRAPRAGNGGHRMLTGLTGGAPAVVVGVCG